MDNLSLFDSMNKESKQTKAPLQRVQQTLKHLGVELETDSSNKTTQNIRLLRTTPQYSNVRSLIFNNLIKKSIFPKLNIKKCHEIAENNVSKLFTSPEALDVLRLFASVGLKSQLGYNSGSGDMNLVISLPPASVCTSIQTPQQALIFMMLGILPDQLNLECDYELCVRSGDLYFFNAPQTRSLSTFETNCSELDAMNQRVSTLLRDGAPTPVLLVNRCIHMFFAQTQMAILNRKFDYTQSTLTLTLASGTRQLTGVRHSPSGAPPTHKYLVTSTVEALDPDSMQDIRLLEEELALASDVNGNASFDIHGDSFFASPFIYSDQGDALFRYSPVYALISGFNTSAFQNYVKNQTEDIKPNDLWAANNVEAQRLALETILVERFWKYVTDVLRYFPSQQLLERVTVVLQKYMASGTKQVSASFNPDQPMTIFLWGTAGTGKSTFVRVFSDALRFVVSRAFEPQKRVEIVRVPFNQTSPAALVSMLMVRGISDWSLERIVEQCVCRAGLALLHLEEQPPSPSLQDELFGLTSKMVTTLCNRYPEYRHNVINVLTSNYPPSPGIENKKETQTVVITPPDHATQSVWCARTLEDIIASNVMQLPIVHNLQVHEVKTTNHSCDLPSFLTYPSPPPYFQPSTLSSAVIQLNPSQAGQQRFLRFLIAIDLQSPPLFTPDLRKLETWKRSIAFSILSHLFTHAEEALDVAQQGPTHCDSLLPSHINPTRSKSHRSKTLVTRGKKQQTPFLSNSSLLNLALTASLVSSPHPTIEGAISLTVNFQCVASNTTMAPMAPGQSSEKSVIEPLYLASLDGFFFFFDTQKQESWKQAHKSLVSTTNFSLVPSLPIAIPSTIPKASFGRIRAVLDMWISNFLRPAVLVLSGTSQQIEEAASFVRHFTHLLTNPVKPAEVRSNQRFTVKDATVLVNTNILALEVDEIAEQARGSGGVITDDTIVSPHLAAKYFFPNQPAAWSQNMSSVDSASLPPLYEFYANATTENHRRQLFGDPDPVSGALLRFIQAVNIETTKFAQSKADLQTPTQETTNSKTDIEVEHGCVGVVYCRVNSLGQFMLRELLDAGESSTHITNVKKDRLLFVVMVEKCEQEARDNAAGDQSDDKNSNIQPQLVSRSHCVVNLE